MLNKSILMGRITKDPEIRHTNSGKAVTSFTIAVDNGHGENKKTDFINCVAWEKTAEFIKNYFSKGRMIVLVGRISTRTYEGQDGRKNYVTEVIAQEVFFGDSKKEESETVSGDEFISVADEDLPWNMPSSAL
jgi:single-strand DNA-binding protein